jgi:hypothetical protein
MQVSKGLKRATGRGEQVQHHLGTLYFDSPLEFSMASPKVSRLEALSVPSPRGRRLLVKRQSQVPQSSTSPQIQTTIG